MKRIVSLLAFLIAFTVCNAQLPTVQVSSKASNAAPRYDRFTITLQGNSVKAGATIKHLQSDILFTVVSVKNDKKSQVVTLAATNIACVKAPQNGDQFLVFNKN